VPETREVFKFEATGALAATTTFDTWVADFNGEIVDVTANLGTVGTVTTTIIDIRKNGTTMYRTSPDLRPTFAISGATLVAPAAWANNTAYVVGNRVIVSAAQVGEALPQSEGYGTPGVYECLVAHTSPATGNFALAPSGGYGSGAIGGGGIAGTPLWQEVPGNYAPEIGSSTFVKGDVLTAFCVQTGTSAANLDMDVEYVAE
jgi:hypothetical protein